MDSSIAFQAVAILILIALSSFFSSAETAMTTVNKIRIQSLAEQGNKRAVILEKIISNSPKMLSTVLIGNNIVNMSVSSLMTTLTIKILGNAYVGITTGILTLLILIFGEITPKNLATIHAEKLSLAYSRIIYGLMILLTPVVFIVNKITEGVLVILHVNPDEKANAMTEHELRTLVNVGEKDGVIENEEKQMIYNVFDFGDSTAKDVMIPRIDMTFIDINFSYDELMAVFSEDMHTRFPVYEDNTDNVIGIINMKDLLVYPKDKPFSIRNILREPYFTYEYKATADLMIEMRKASVNLAIVLDEYGATAGLVTLEDLLEEIVGEIRDEYDEDEVEDIKEIQPEREYVVQGSAKLDDINEALHINLESEDYDSIGGYIIEQLDCLPKEGQSVTLESGIRLVVDRLEQKQNRTCPHLASRRRKPKQKNSRNCHLSSISENCFTILESSPVTASISFFVLSPVFSGNSICIHRHHIKFCFRIQELIIHQTSSCMVRFAAQNRSFYFQFCMICHLSGINCVLISKGCLVFFQDFLIRNSVFIRTSLRNSHSVPYSLSYTLLFSRTPENFPFTTLYFPLGRIQSAIPFLNNSAAFSAICG